MCPRNPGKSPSGARNMAPLLTLPLLLVYLSLLHLAQENEFFTPMVLSRTSALGAALVTWVKKALELSAGNTPLKRAHTALAEAARHLTEKEALLAKAQEALALLEGEVRALRAAKEAAEKAVSGAAEAEKAAGGAAAGGGGGSA
jgi:hypothetical protein